MLFSIPTPKGSGLTVYGDFLEMDTLYATIHHIAKSMDNIEHFHGQFQTLLYVQYRSISLRSKTNSVKFEPAPRIITFL